MKQLKNITDWKECINQVVCGDCLEGMKLIPDNSVDLIVTSPPYDNLRDYEGFEWDFEKTAQELKRVLKDGGVIVWIVGDQTVDGSETGTSFKQALYFKEIGLNLHDTMIYQKNVMPFPQQTRYIQCFEYMFVFSKGKPKTTNLIKDKTKGYKGSKSSKQRNKDGTTSALKYEQGKDERSRWNVWVYEVGYGKTTLDKRMYLHPAMFPEKLSEDHIKSWSNNNDLILDPFMGSWTTARACKDLGRNFIGFELEQKYCEIGEKRLEQLNLF